MQLSAYENVTPENVKFTDSKEEDPTRSYKILRDNTQKCYGIHINRKQDSIRFYGILDKNAMESISIANKIIQDSTG